mmetsp:Transcript_18150/g.46475  ORF Transcript_18150/g.46475 Transcript_18150/m.46475 type:complete len:223 (+) Transcript_18150:126-794(+)
MQALLGEASQRGRELEGPQEVGGLLEGGASGDDLVDEVLNTDDVVLAQDLLNHAVVRQRDAVAVDLAIPALVDELLHGLQVGVAPGDVGLHAAQHVDGGLVHLHEHAVVDLAQPEQLQDLAGLGVHVVDTTDADHEHDLRLGLDVEAVLGLGLPLQADQVLLLVAVLLHVLLGALEDVLALRLGGGLGGGGLARLLGGPVLIALPLLQHALGDPGSHIDRLS